MSEFKAVIVGENYSPVMNKSNGGQFRLVDCKITEDGPLKGLTVPGTLTIKNAEGKEKELREVGEEVTLYHTQLPSEKHKGGFMHFFEIGSGINTASMEELTNAFASINVASEQKV